MMSTSHTSHTSQQDLMTAVADAYPELHAMRVEAGRRAAAYRDAKEKKMPNDITFHNAATHWKGHVEEGLFDGSKLSGSERTSDQVKVVDDDHLGKQGRR